MLSSTSRMITLFRQNKNPITSRDSILSSIFILMLYIGETYKIKYRRRNYVYYPHNDDKPAYIEDYITGILTDKYIYEGSFVLVIKVNNDEIGLSINDKHAPYQILSIESVFPHFPRLGDTVMYDVITPTGQTIMSDMILDVDYISTSSEPDDIILSECIGTHTVLFYRVGKNIRILRHGYQYRYRTSFLDQGFPFLPEQISKCIKVHSCQGKKKRRK